MKLNELRNKKILILGFGREGIDTFLFLRKIFPNKIFGIADKSEKIKKPGKKTVLHLGKNYLEAIKKYDLVVKSPGIPFRILPKSSLKKLTSQTEIFLIIAQGKLSVSQGLKVKAQQPP